MKRFRLQLFGVACWVCAACAFGQSNDLSIGFLYDKFPLTLAPGEREEAAGPLFYRQVSDTQTTFALPPLFSCVRDPAVESEERDFLYPLVSYDRYGKEYRWHILQLFSFAGGQDQEEQMTRRFTLFPFYFQQRSKDTNLNYTAVLPFYGTLKNRLMRDEIHFIMFPIYGQSRKKDVVTDNYLYPVFHLRHGDQLKGWQVWPIVGHEHRNPTTVTNFYTEAAEIRGGHDKLFVVWPFFFKEYHNLGTTNVERQWTLIPFYNEMTSPQRDMRNYGWPFGYTVIEDREKQYHEWGAPWPLVSFAHGPGKTTRRVWPFFSKSTNATLESTWYGWFVYKYNSYHSEALDYQRTRVFYYLYSDKTWKNNQTGKESKRVDFLPFYTRTRDFDGTTRLQVLSILEPFLPTSKSIERNYSQLWSIWRQEKNAKTGATSQSLLWNLYRRDTSPQSQKVSAFFGMFQSETTSEGRRLRLFYIPIGKKK